MNYEITSLIRWSLKDKKNLINSCNWIKSVMSRKLIGRFSSHYSVNSYPLELQKLLTQTINGMPIKNNFSGKISDSNHEPPEAILLASKKIQINNEIDWELEFDDPEDIESLHRWNWLTYLASDVNNNSKNLNWSINQIEKWCNKYHKECFLPDKKLNNLLRWESYTISERISNCILISHLNNIELTDIIKESLIDQTKLLFRRLEYFNSFTGNHIINNARAIYFSGLFFGVREWSNFARTILELELKKLVTIDGFLREGSSHYQFLFTRWMIEILFFAELFSDKKASSLLKPFVKKLINKTIFFTILDKNNKSTDIPLFGDISPDFPPEWLKDFCESNLININENSHLPEKSWNRLWEKLNKPIINNLNSNDENDSIMSFKNSGWHRVEKYDFTLMLRLDKNGFPPYVGHHHNDVGHFYLYYKGLPIFVDSGRINYHDQFGLTPAAHNTIAFDQINGVVPAKPFRYPYDYSNCSNSIKIINNDKECKLLLTSDGFARFDDGIIWEREIVIQSKSFSISDQLIGNGSYNLYTWFHFDRKAQCVLNNDKNNYKFNLHNESIFFSIHNLNSKKVSLFNGGDSVLGWQSTRYGTKYPKPTIEIISKINLPFKSEYSLTVE